MGSWGYGSFENDGALDWADQLCYGSGIEAMLDALTKAADLRDEYLEVDDAQYAVAAAEVVAALNGALVPDLPERVKIWLSQPQHFDHTWLELALKAVERVKTDSELQDLYDGEENEQEWHRSIDSLIGRLYQQNTK